MEEKRGGREGKGFWVISFKEHVSGDIYAQEFLQKKVLKRAPRTTMVDKYILDPFLVSTRTKWISFVKSLKKNTSVATIKLQNLNLFLKIRAHAGKSLELPTKYRIQPSGSC